MNTVDIPLPDIEFELIKQLPTFTLIYPADHPLAQAARADMVVRILSFTEDDYSEILESSSTSAEISKSEISKFTPIENTLYDIFYIRECLASRVTKDEWENNYGPNSYREFRQKLKSKADNYVKIISLCRVNYSLKTLNKHYYYER
jgi:hypothetical protein